MKKIASFLGIVAISAMLVIPASVGADGVVTNPNFELNLRDPLGPDSSIEGLLERIVNWLILISAPIAAGMIIYGAYQVLFAGGDPEKFKNGKRTMLYTVIGYAIIFIGWGLVSIIEEFLREGAS